LQCQRSVSASELFTVLVQLPPLEVPLCERKRRCKIQIGVVPARDVWLPVREDQVYVHCWLETDETQSEGKRYDISIE
jgi:hypothetical protein